MCSCPLHYRCEQEYGTAKNGVAKIIAEHPVARLLVSEPKAVNPNQKELSAVVEDLDAALDLLLAKVSLVETIQNAASQMTQKAASQMTQ